MFLMLYSINLPNFIVWLTLLLEILGNICIAMVCFLGNDVKRFEINLNLLIRRFSTWPESQYKNSSNLKTKITSKVKKTTHFIIFKGCQSLSQTWGCVFKEFIFFFIWDITQKYHDKFVYIFVAVTVVINVISTIGFFSWSFLIKKESYLLMVRT